VDRLPGRLFRANKGNSYHFVEGCGCHCGRTVSEAETCFSKAIDVTRRQSAKSLELRAVMSLSRLWQKQGKTDEAQRMLAEIYGWFTEGFDTADL